MLYFPSRCIFLFLRLFGLFCSILHLEDLRHTASTDWVHPAVHSSTFLLQTPTLLKTGLRNAILGIYFSRVQGALPEFSLPVSPQLQCCTSWAPGKGKAINTNGRILLLKKQFIACLHWPATLFPVPKGTL